MSQSEVNASVKRLRSAKLVHEKDLDEGPILAAVEEFLIHGVKYAFPPNMVGSVAERQHPTQPSPCVD